MQKASHSAVSADPHAAVRRWLFVVAGLIALMVVVGAGARLAEPGLSIAQWPKLAGALPPLSAEDWRDAFERFKLTPHGAPALPDMDLTRFRTLALWVWAHGLLQPLIALVFVAPLLIFWIRGRIVGALRLNLLAILALGALQGLGGGWLASSGLAPQARLALDLLLACLVFAALFWTAEALRPNFRDPMGRDARGFRFEAGLLLVLLFAQIGFGALAAGTRAGLMFQSWPLMDGRFFPPAEILFSLTPLWANVVDNRALVEFQHRITADLLALLALFHAFHISRERLARRAVRRAAALAALILAQAALGVAALLLAAPLPAALAHLALAMGVLALATLHRRKLG